jgi:hypothetical protein
MNDGFVSILLEDYVTLHLRSNPAFDRAELIECLQHAIDAHKNGKRCRCGAPIWIIGSAMAGLACFTCITGEASPDNDYEIGL